MLHMRVKLKKKTSKVSVEFINPPHFPPQIVTRMHSSRMRTVRCSGRLLGGVYPWGRLPKGVSA